MTTFDPDVEAILARTATRPAAPFVRAFLSACKDDHGLRVGGPQFGARAYVNVHPPGTGRRLAVVTSPGTGRTQFSLPPTFADGEPLAEVVLVNGAPRRPKVMLTSSEAVEACLRLTLLALEEL